MTSNKVATTRAPADEALIPPAPYGRNVQLLRLLGLAVMVGMSAFLAVVTHAPLTAVVMVSEMTSGYGLVPALVLASLAGYYVSSELHPRSIYAYSIPQDHPTQNTPSLRL